MLKLANPFETPPGYFRFPRHLDQPVTEKNLIYGGDIVDLVSKVAEFRIANGMSVANLELEIGDWLCRNTGATCKPAAPARVDQGVKISGIAVLRFLNAMAAWTVNGGSVEQEEAERRAEVCSGCRFNTFIEDSSCLGCAGAAAKIMRIVGDKKTRVDDSLKFCGACGCSLHVVPFVPLDILNRAHTNSDFPDDTGQGDKDGNPIPCWRKAGA